MTIEIPENLYWLSAIYEYRLWILLPILFIGLCFLGHSLLKQKKRFFIYAVLFPMLFSFAGMACTWCGWRYRMELRNRYAVENFLSTESTDRAININLMPPHIYKEYAKHDFSPRFRDIKAMMVGTIIFVPILFLLEASAWLLFGRFQRRKKLKYKDHVCE